MVEMIDKDTNKKIMAMVMCGICYMGECYLIYCIRRNETEFNLFLSKLIKSSNGYSIHFDFKNGEKEAMNGVVQRIINCDSVAELEQDGFSIMKNISFDGVLYFDIERCYVSTVLRSLVKKCFIFYGLVNESLFQQPVVEVAEDKKFFSEGFVSNIMLIILGIFVFIFSIVVIWGFLFR